MIMLYDYYITCQVQLFVVITCGYKAWHNFVCNIIIIHETIADAITF